MALKAVEHQFRGQTTPLALISYGTVAVSGTAVTGTGTFFNSSIVGMRIGFGSFYISGITTWYTISGYTSGTSITLSTSSFLDNLDSLLPTLLTNSLMIG